MSGIRITTIALALASGLFMPQAFSHISLETKEATLETNYKAVLRVPHGCQGSSTTSLQVSIPEGVVGVKPQPKAGWSVSTRQGDYARSYTQHGAELSAGVKEIVWSGGSLPDAHYDEFVFLAYLSKGLEPDTTLHFPVIQICEKGAEHWTGTGGHHHGAHGHAHGHGTAQQPAPALKLLPKRMAVADHTQIVVGEPWVRATVPQQSGTGAFMTLTSPADTTLVQADSPVAKHVEVHEMAMENHVMKMRQLAKGLPLPAGQTVELKPGGYHIMLIDLNGQVKEGEQVPLTLTFENADGQRSSIDIQAPVRPLASGAGGHGGAHGHGHTHDHGAHGAAKH